MLGGVGDPLLVLDLLPVVRVHVTQETRLETERFHAPFETGAEALVDQCCRLVLT